MPPRLLVVEDSRDIALLIRFHASEMPATVELVADGIAGYGEARSGRYDLILLDISLPGMDGLTLLERLRHEGIDTPVLLLTGRIDAVPAGVLAQSNVRALAKPFGVVALLERVREMLAPPSATPSGDHGPIIARDGLRIDVVGRCVHVNERPIALDAREFDLLVALAQSPGRVFIRHQLLDMVWHDHDESNAHIVNTHIHRLRAKLESDPSRPVWIRGGTAGGYCFGAETRAGRSSDAS